MTGEGWSRRGLAAALAPALLSACVTPAERRLISINLADTGPVQGPPPDAGAQLETAFDQARRMVVPVFLNSKGPYGFVVDTGANRSVVSTEVAAACGLPSAGQADVHGIAGAEPAALALVSRLSVAAVTSRDMVLPVLDRSRLGADGLLGVDMLKGRHMSLDFLDNRFEISPSGYGMEVGQGSNTRIRGDTDPIQVAAAIRDGQLVILDAQVADVRVAAFIDSGAQVTVGNHALRDAVVHTHPDFGPRLAPVPLLSATGQTMMGEFAPLPVLRLGGMQIYDVLGIFAELHIFDLWKLSDRPAILIGVDVLRHFQSVTLDFYRKVVVFQPAPPGDPRLRLQTRQGGR
ncbi:aspartyl protease family protein [Phenylobacterium sp.]|uniref:aspartyl protease family protein n=1 Tax=Phenylobacterium sp. TaxID=1871053 RepID=UPI002D0E5FC1|nr:aspartyl protease family protein [Phenylobacterium sp.]HLZ76516.1 aspartyl protease family protein [Phenylobacterium sp.]